MKNTLDETFDLFFDFFKGKKQVNFYPNGCRAGYDEMGQILFDEFKNTTFGKKCMRQAAENGCKFVFNPEARGNDGKEKRKSVQGEFLYQKHFKRLNIYINDPVKALSNLDHEGTHFIQRVKLAKSFPDVNFENVDFDKFIAIHMVFEADAFSKQMEYAYFDREHPEKFADLKNDKGFYGRLAEVYEKTYKEGGNKNDAYTATFDEVFKNKGIAEFYSKNLTDQYLKLGIYKSKHGDVNVARLVQILSDKRYKYPDKIMDMTKDKFTFSEKEWTEVNGKNSEYEVLTGRGDDSYKNFKVRSSTNDCSHLRNYMKFVFVNNKAVKGDRLGDAVRLSRKRAWKTVSDYSEDKIPITEIGDCKKEITEWIRQERKQAVLDNNRKVLTKLLETERFIETIDSRKTIDEATLAAQREKEKRYNRQNPRQTGGISPTAYYAQGRQV